MQEQTQTHSSSRCLLLALLLIVLVGAILYALSQLGGSGGLGYSFEQQEAFRLAQETQAYRRTHPTPANYGLASITVFSQDGSSRRFVPTSHGIIVPFVSTPGKHSEISAHDWILDELAILRKARYIDANTTDITVIIFSQVRVCASCRIALRDWQQEFRQTSGFPTLALSIWQLTRGYDPAIVPKGKPVSSPDDVTEVTIAFISLHTDKEQDTSSLDASPCQC
jgi:hypothetical protein